MDTVTDIKVSRYILYKVTEAQIRRKALEMREIYGCLHHEKKEKIVLI